MSKTKLTLSVPENVVKLAKRYALQHKTSLSSIVSRLFRALLILPEGPDKKDDEGAEAAILTEACVGIISHTEKSKSDLISDALAERYSKK